MISRFQTFPMFRELNIKTNYSSEEDNLYDDFFLPVLREAVTYKRAVGFFSLGVLLNAPAAMSRIVQSNGRIELIFGKLISQDDFDAVRKGLLLPWKKDDLPSFIDIIQEHHGSLLEYRIRILAWLFSNNHLEMKVAIRPNGLFHQKIGLLKDSNDNTISFSGSMNETVSALDPKLNSEEISVFRSWATGQRDYVERHEDNFERLWSEDTGSSTVIFKIPDIIEEGLSLVSERFPNYPDPNEETKLLHAFLEKRRTSNISSPMIPETLNGNSFEMRKHQIDALQAWRENNCNGILELATGAGKTITAIYAATQTAKLNEGIVLIVSVPYQDLADQWCGELFKFNIRAIPCYGSRSEWEPQVNAYLKRNRGGRKEFLAIVVVNNTLLTDHFQMFVRQLDNDRIFFIGDECHHHGGLRFNGMLLPEAKFRIGLSATPFHYFDDARNKRLRDVYDKSVFEYDLARSVRDEVLTPYEYIPIPVEMTDGESQEYTDLSRRISHAFMSREERISESDDEKLNALLMQRARLVGTVENKMVELGRLLDKKEITSHSLFYCSDGKISINDDKLKDKPTLDNSSSEVKQRHAVAKMLMNREIRVSPFTSDEARWQRRKILCQFKTGEIDAIVAIRCLDEGIDVPSCKTAYLIASSRNPRQFIQRRGRILRRAPGKNKALIYDFVVVGMPVNKFRYEHNTSDLLREELYRVADFARNSLYPQSSIKPLLPWLKKYDLEYMV